MSGESVGMHCWTKLQVQRRQLSHRVEASRYDRVSIALTFRLLVLCVAPSACICHRSPESSPGPRPRPPRPPVCLGSRDGPTRTSPPHPPPPRQQQQQQQRDDGAAPRRRMRRHASRTVAVHGGRENYAAAEAEGRRGIGCSQGQAGDGCHRRKLQDRSRAA